MAQTYTNLEIILVDDGSPDNCGKICDDLASEDSRIKVVHKENGGLSDARNCGVEMARGEYITFIDSDDYVSEEYVEYLYDLLKVNNADTSCCCYVKTNGDTAEFGISDNLLDVQTMTGWEACKRLHADLYLVLVVAWAKLYRAEIVKKHSFPVGRIHEDEATTFKFFYDSSIVVVGNRELYAYYQRPDSIMGKRKEGDSVNVIWAMEQRGYAFEQMKEFELAQCTWDVLFNRCVMESMDYNGIHDRYLKNFKTGKRLSRKTILHLMLYNIHPVVYKMYVWRGSLLKVLKAKVKTFLGKHEV